VPSATRTWHRKGALDVGAGSVLVSMGVWALFGFLTNIQSQVIDSSFRVIQESKAYNLEFVTDNHFPHFGKHFAPASED
jgi:hypothetical protein